MKKPALTLVAPALTPEQRAACRAAFVEIYARAYAIRLGRATQESEATKERDRPGDLVRAA